MENIFKNPTKYIQQLRKIELIKVKKDTEFLGKSIAVIFLTRYCNADCKFCIFKSPTKKQHEVTREDELDEIGIKKSIEFINKSNIGYLLISGGGEPFLKTEYLLDLINNVNVKEIVIVSNGFWANNYDRALGILNKIKQIQNESEKTITIRISVDKWHSENLGILHIKNLIDIFYEKFNDYEGLKLKIHTIINDNTIFEVLKKYQYSYNIKYQEEYSSDNALLNKSNRSRTFIEFMNGYQLEIEFAKLFNPNLEVDLNENIEKQVDVFVEDLVKSQDGNFSTVTNINDTKGLDFLISYNGNVSTWGNYQTYNSPNIYTHNYEEVMRKIYNDVISYSFLKEPLTNIINIVEKVNANAVKRAIGINIRDYFGMYLLYENKTLLYYYIIILKRYSNEGLVNLDLIPEEIKKILELSEENIIELYNRSEYSIINQFEEDKFSKEKWEDLFFLIGKKHFELSETQIKHAIEYYNQKTKQKYEKYEEIINYNDVNRYRRLLKRFNI